MGLGALLEEVTLVQDVDSFDPESEGITLITLHAAKGLEFPVVMILGMEEGLCPHSRSLTDETQMEEERRLVYVGITRAERAVYLLHTTRRTLFGMTRTNQPSRFLVDIPPRLQVRYGSRAEQAARRSEGASRPPSMPTHQAALEALRALPTRAAGTGSPSATPASLEGERQYRPGDKVFHPTFGSGVIVESTQTRSGEEVVVAFEGKGIKKLSLAYAPLERG
jgi:DNA helicase-2/ATP-dependent DNA helicase PcrA